MISYGGWVWPSLLMLAALAGAATLAAITRARKRRAARRARASFGSAVPWDAATAGEVVVVVGTLRADDPVDAFLASDRVAATTLYAVAGEPLLAKTKRSGRLWLEREGARIELEGELRLAVGSIETRAAHGDTIVALPTDIDDETVATLIEQGARPGDLVRVAGRLAVRSGGEEDATYRDASARHVLRPSTDGEPMAACFEGTPRPEKTDRRRALRAAIVAAGLALGALYAMGEVALADARETLEAEAFVGDRFRRLSLATESSAANLAALSPFHRDDVLHLLYRAREQGGPATRKRVEEMLELARLEGACYWQAKLFSQRRAPELFDRIDPSCRTESAEIVEAACAVGDIDTARDGLRASGYVSRLDAAKVHLLANASEDAASALSEEAEVEDDVREELRRTLAGRSDDAPELGHDPVASSERRSEALRCLAAALRVGAGAPLSTLSSAASGSSSQTCGLLHYEADPSKPRPELNASARLLATLEALVAIRRGDLEVDESLFVAPTLAGLTRRLGLDFHGLAAAALETLLETEPEEAKPRRIAAALLLARARFERLVGELAAARGSIEEATEQLEALDDPRSTELEGHAHALRVLVEVEARDLGAARAALAADRAAFVRDDARRLEALLDSLAAAPRETRVPAFVPMESGRRAVVAGLLARNGRATAWTLYKGRGLDWPVLRVFADEGMRDRERLVEAVRYGARVYDPCNPVEAVRGLGHERVIAEALGDVEWASAATTILEPHRAALEDPERAIPLLLLGSNEYVY